LKIGNTAEEVVDYYEKLRTSLTDSPVTYLGTPANGARLDGLIVEKLYSSRTFPTVASMLRKLREAVDSGSSTVDATAVDAAARPSRAAMGIFPYINTWPEEEFGTFLAVTCNDTPWSQDRSYWEQTSRAQGKKYPLAGWWQVDNPCAYWNRSALSMPVPTGKDVPPVLMVQSRHDPATPYEGAVIAHKNFTPSRMITVENEGDHGIYGNGISCVDQTVNDFLTKGKLPRTDISCQGAEIPAP
jgi:hypothetical protein